MVVVLRRRDRLDRRRRLRILGGVALAAILFLAGALAQRQGWLSGAAETLGRARAALTHPRKVLDAMIHGEELPELRIEVKFLDMQRIEEKRAEALRRGLLLSSGDDFVPATIHAGGEPLRAKIRLKGDILDHIMTSKWSFRVHLRGSSRYAGMRRFSIQHPKTRFYLNEWAFLETMRSEGILAPRYHFARVWLNGESKGIYAVEEAFARELLESQRRREGLLVGLDEDPFHRWFHERPPGEEAGIDVNPVSDRNVGLDPFDEGRIAADPALTRQWGRARWLLERWFRGGDDVLASEVFDPDVLGRYFAVCELWGAIHPLRWGNVRFYYNPVTDRIEPVAYDGNVSTPGGNGPPGLLALGAVREGLPGTPWTRRALRDPAVARVYLAALERLLAPESVAGLERRLGDRWSAHATTLGGEYPEVDLGPPWKRLRMRASRLAAALRPARHAMAVLTPAGPGAPPTLEVADVLSVPIRVLAVEADGRRIESDVVLPACLPDEVPVFLEFPLPPGDGPVGTVVVETRILGMSEIHRTAARIVPGALAAGVPAAPTVGECLARHPFLESVPARDDVLRVRPGRHDVGGDLILPAGVRLEAGPGTVLRFGEDALLLARGPVDLRGDEEAPVVLEPRAGRWQGIAVLDARAVSRWDHAVVRGTRGVARGGWVLTSGVTFHRSPVHLRACAFLDHRGLDDQLNVFRSRVELIGCEFGDCGGDAFDGDFVEGRIEHCSFHDVDGDAIDFSGTRELVIRDTAVLRIGDKGVSAGEDSHVRVERLLAEDVSIGVAAKDRSVVVLHGATLRRAQFGLAAYRKKPEYGPGRIDATDVRFEDVDRRTIIQSGSAVILEGRRIHGSKMDVKRLYQAGILGN